MAHTFGGFSAEEPRWTLEDIAGVVENPKLTSGEDGEQVLRAGCPAHDGKDRNCKFSYGADGTLLAHCFSNNCAFEKIVGALREKMNGGSSSARVPEARLITRNPSGASKKKVGRKAVGETVWEICDEFGTPVAYHVRTDYDDGTKKVAWRLPDGTPSLKPAGYKPSDLPLYGIEKAVKASPEVPIIVTEGEKAADAVLAAGIPAVGTVTGAAGTPNGFALGALKGRTVVVWPDNDTAGHHHMSRVAAGLFEAGANVHWFEWDEAPDKGDAHDFLEVHDAQKMRLDLAENWTIWSKPPVIEGRALLGRAIKDGIEPPEELLPGVLLAAKAHNIFAPGGAGKTWLLVWLAAELVKTGKKVVVFDSENGLRDYAERFEELGSDPDALDELIHYWPFPTFEAEQYARMLDEEKPKAVMFDSWIGFLVANGGDENDSSAISTWSEAYLKPARSRGIAVVTLDHVGHEHDKRERGSRRKRDEMDVSWSMSVSEEFDRHKVGSLALALEKDRAGWLPRKVELAIGGDEKAGRFRMERKSAGIETEFEKHKKHLAYKALEDLGLGGGQVKDWVPAFQALGGGSKSTLHRYRRILLEKGNIVKDGDVYRCVAAP